MGDWTQAPDGSYVGGSEWIMAPDGTYVGGSTWTMAPDGTYVGGPDGRRPRMELTWVAATGSWHRMALTWA